jgi:hypothetical protein
VPCTKRPSSTTSSSVALASEIARVGERFISRSGSDDHLASMAGAAGVPGSDRRSLLLAAESGAPSPEQKHNIPQTLACRPVGPNQRQPLRLLWRLNSLDGNFRDHPEHWPDGYGVTALFEGPNRRFRLTHSVLEPVCFVPCNWPKHCLSPKLG